MLTVLTNIVKDGDKKLHHCTQFICMSLKMQHVNTLFLIRLMEFNECREVGLPGVFTLCCQFVMILQY